MLMVRELTDEEVEELAKKFKGLDYVYDGENEYPFDTFEPLAFARALFEAAKVQQSDR